MSFKDFEEFKAHFELFSRIDTPAKLEICKNRYEAHLKHLKSLEYFEPEIGAGLSGSSLEYRTRLNQILETLQIREGEFYFLIQPAFDPEALLMLRKTTGKYTAVFKELQHNYWSSGKQTEPGIQFFKTELSPQIGEKIFCCLDQAMNEAKKLPGGNLVIDGTKYFLLRRFNGEIQAVSKHSPNESSKTGKIIAALASLADYMKNADEKKLEDVVLLLNQVY